MHYQIYHSEILHSARTVYLRVVSMDLSKNRDCLYRMNWLDFVTDTESVYCAVRTEALNIKLVCLVRRRVHLVHVLYYLGVRGHWFDS